MKVRIDESTSRALFYSSMFKHRSTPFVICERNQFTTIAIERSGVSSLRRVKEKREKKKHTQQDFVSNSTNMGQTLSEPVVTKKTTTVFNDQLLVCSTCMQGWRVTMEDAHTHIIGQNDEPSYFGVFDGHGGTALAEHVSKKIYNKIINQKHFREGNIAEGLKRAHLDLDYEMSYDPQLREDSSGTTAISVIIKDNTIYCANVGDSRALACVGGEMVELSKDHKPSNPAETQRIIAAGGWVELNRVNGNLALSRALGDFSYKKNPHKTAENQMVTASPDITTYTITSEHEFLILACDGIWDVLTNYEVLRFVRTRISQSVQPKQICEELLDTCLAPDSQMGGLGCDNMTVMLVCFMDGKPYSDLVRRCSRPARGPPSPQDH